MKTKVLELIALVALLGLSPAKATTYNVDFSKVASVKGFIKTDGATGSLSVGNITDWDLTITQTGGCFTCTGSFTFLGPDSGNDSTVNVAGNSLYATPSQLTFNYSILGSIFSFATTITPVNRVDLEWNSFVLNGGVIEIYADAPLLTPPVFVSSITYGEPGIFTIGSTPLPAGLPLFGTGLGLMGLFGWRRKRKNAAA
jgi:hypothetical protein